MVKVKHDAVDEHEGTVKDIEEDFVIEDIAIVALEGFDDAVDVPSKDQATACVQEVDGGS